MRWGCCLLFACACAAGAARADARGDLETVKARLLAQSHQDAPDLKPVRDWARAQREDGSWSGINYDATDRTIWAPMTHLDRLMAIAQALESGKIPAEERASAAQSFVRGFDFWLARDPQSSNWWYNEIGAPASLYRVMLLGEPLLTGGRLDKGCAVLARSKLAMTGQNLVWLAENVIGRACLQRDPDLMAAAFKRIEQEIVVSEKEGIQPDFSFHQHGAQLYSGGYGNGFAANAPRFALLAQGTAFAFAPEKIRILESYLLDGQQWMIRGTQFDHSASGRELTRANSGRAGGYAANAQSLLKLDAAARRAELQALAARVAHGAAPASALTGHRHFWCSDYTVHHRPEWMVSVRMTSVRLQQTELVNGENLLGEHLSDGVMYLYRTGGEYRNIFPVWDWARLPGITVEQDRPAGRVDNKRRGARTFVGGSSDGRCGVSAMDFERDGLAAKKAWFFFDGEVVCLGSGISSDSGHRVITSVNQCLADGPVTVCRASGESAELKSPEKLAKPKWVQQGGIGYVFLDGADSVGVGASVQTGSWKRISSARKADPVSADVFSLWIDHGRKPQGSVYAYAVVPAADGAAMEAFASALPVRVIANTPRLQAVEDVGAGCLQAAFYAAGKVASRSFGEIGVDAPCLLSLCRTNGQMRATLCNPENRAGEIHVAVGARTACVRLPSAPLAGSSVSQAL